MTALRSLLLVCVGWCIAALAWAETRVGEIENPRTSHGGWLTDKAGVLGEYAPEIERTLESLHRETQAEVAVVIVQSVDGANEKEFAVELFNHWGIGNKRDEGVLVLHVLDTRRVEIETGYGVEGAMPDVKCAWLLDEVAVPHFKEGALGRGHAALARGVAYGIRNPEATREALLAAALGEQVSSQSARENAGESSAWESFGTLLRSVGPGFAIAAVFAGFAGLLRRSGLRSLYRNKKRKPDDFVGILLVALILVGIAFFLAAWVTDLHVMAWTGVVSLGGLGAYLITAAWRDFREARRRYAPRSCRTCNTPMVLVSDSKDERFLSEGQRAEERVGSADHFVWRCSCGAIQTERYKDEREATVCAECNFQTEVRKKVKVVRHATTRATGLQKVTYQCANCKQRRVVQEEIPKRDPPSSGTSSGGSGSSRGPSSSSSSSGSRSFGGGRSGGGGAGRSY